MAGQRVIAYDGVCFLSVLEQYYGKMVIAIDM